MFMIFDITAFTVRSLGEIDYILHNLNNCIPLLIINSDLYIYHVYKFNILGMVTP